MLTSPDTLEQLPSAAASEIKKQGWRGVMRTVLRSGPLLITNHNQPEAVIMSAQGYESLLQALSAAQDSRADPLAALRKRFDEQLESLNQEDASARLLELNESPPDISGKVIVGKSY